MTKEEFISRLKENKKNFKNVEELIEYQLPVLQYYLSNHCATIIVDNRPLGGTENIVDLSKIVIEPSGAENNLYLMNVAFEGLVKRIKEFEDEN